MNIGILILATNIYFILGLLFIKQFMYHYKGKCNIIFYFFSDKNVNDFINPEKIKVVHFKTHHNSWVDATNDKFNSFIKVEEKIRSEVDYIYYFDADTSITKDFDERWMIGDLIGGEHFLNPLNLENPFDRNPKSKAYIPKEGVERMYYYGAFFGGKVDNVIEFCKILISWQKYDKEILNYEPVWNDESYINKYFNTFPHDTVLLQYFVPNISDKAGLQNTRDTNKDCDKEIYSFLSINIEEPFCFKNGNIRIYPI